MLILLRTLAGVAFSQRPLLFILNNHKHIPLYPHGLSNGSGAPPKPPPLGFDGGATGVCVVDAEVHPPKSSSAVTDGCRAGRLLEADIGSPHPPEMSSGVMRAGGFPNSTLGWTGFAGVGSGAPHGLLSLPAPHGSNIAVLLCGMAAGDLNGWDAGFGTAAGCEDKLKGELKAAVLLGGDIIAGLGGEAGVELAKPPKSSAANRSAGIDVAVAAGLGAGAGCGAAGL